MARLKQEKERAFSTLAKSSHLISVNLILINFLIASRSPSPPTFPYQLSHVGMRLSTIRHLSVMSSSSPSLPAFISPLPLSIRRSFPNSASTRPPCFHLRMSSSTPPPTSSPSIVPADLRAEMTKSYMEYALSVILGRAMPDVRDGLKPVHRRIVFAMHRLNLSSTSAHRKSARVVGEVLGKYHPHGDNAVYDALVRMAQPFSMSAPLVDGHGNFGSTDGDPAAAMRYTECRLSGVCEHVLLSDMGKDVVEFVDNFDASEKEPVVLPARVPNLLVNGAAGIAVGMATNIPPHNLREVCDALRLLIENPHIEDALLREAMPGPDFPTGGEIVGAGGCKDVWETGKGRIVMRARVHGEVIEGESGAKGRRKREAVVVTQLPYQVNKAGLVAKIADMVNDKKIDGVADLRDESDRTGTRIVIELKRDASLAVVMNMLFKKTQLQVAFNANLMALDNGRFPKRFNIREVLENFLRFRRESVRKRVLFELGKAEDRCHIVKGFLVVLNNVDEVVQTIRNSEDISSAKVSLCNDFVLSDKQADAVLGMQLRRLTSLEHSKLTDEAINLEKQIAEFKSILSNPEKLDKGIIEELEKICAKHAVPRRSEIIEANGDKPNDSPDDNELFLNERSVITVTQKGYIKRMPTASFESQNRGTRGKRGAGRMREGDKIAHFLTCMSHDSLIAVSKCGMAYRLPVHKVPLASVGSRGLPMFQLIPSVTAGETLASVLSVTAFEEDKFVVLLTKNGIVKKTALSAFERVDGRGRRIIALDEGDELKWVRHCTKEDSLLIASQYGYIIRFRTDSRDLRATGRTSRGVRAMRLGKGDGIADMDVIEGGSEEKAVNEEEDNSTFLLAVTRLGTGKRILSNSFKLQRRGGLGVKAISLSGNGADRDHLVALQTCVGDDSVMVVTSAGTIVKTGVDNIPVQGRYAKGVRIQKLGSKDTVAAVAIVPRLLVGEEDDDLIIA